MSREPLCDEAIKAAQSTLSGWDYHRHSLAKQFRFKNFRQAIAFVVRLAFDAEAADHHPEINNVYNRVTILLTTHDAGNRVTQKDVDLARAIDRIAESIR